MLVPSTTLPGEVSFERSRFRSCHRWVCMCAAWSAGTSRRRHVLVDWSTCLVEPLFVFPVSCFSAASTSRARPCCQVLSELFAPSCSERTVTALSSS